MTCAMQKGETADQREIIRKLVALQYKRNEAAFARGHFRVRGDNLEIFLSHYEVTAWRISLFGDGIEETTEFELLPGGKIAILDYVKVFPNRPVEHTSELQSLMHFSDAVFCLQTETPLILHT